MTNQNICSNCGHERKYHVKVKGRRIGSCLVSIKFDGIFLKNREEYCNCTKFTLQSPQIKNVDEAPNFVRTLKLQQDKTRDANSQEIDRRVLKSSSEEVNPDALRGRK